jgi:flagellar biosynthetic protein FlhB
MAGDKTEKATPKKRKEARQKGQVARSTDLQGAVVLLAGIIALGSAGPGMVQRMADVMRAGIAQMSSPEVVSKKGIGVLLSNAGEAAALAVAPIALACVLAGVATSIGMVGFKPSGKALQPDAKRMNPVSGLKNILGPNALVELAKSIAKVGVVAGIVAVALLPKLPEFGGMVGISPVDFGTILSADLGMLIKRAAFAYLLIGAADFAWQKRRTEKSLKMDKTEVKDEAKQQNLPAEVRGALRRRQMEISRKRMMSAVPEAAAPRARANQVRRRQRLRDLAGTRRRLCSFLPRNRARGRPRHPERTALPPHLHTRARGQFSRGRGG